MGFRVMRCNVSSSEENFSGFVFMCVGVTLPLCVVGNGKSFLSSRRRTNKKKVRSWLNKNMKSKKKTRHQTCGKCDEARKCTGFSTSVIIVA